MTFFQRTVYTLYYMKHLELSIQTLYLYVAINAYE